MKLPSQNWSVGHTFVQPFWKAVYIYSYVLDFVFGFLLERVLVLYIYMLLVLVCMFRMSVVCVSRECVVCAKCVCVCRVCACMCMCLTVCARAPDHLISTSMRACVRVCTRVARVINYVNKLFGEIERESVCVCVCEKKREEERGVVLCCVVLWCVV